MNMHPDQKAAVEECPQHNPLDILFASHLVYSIHVHLLEP